MSADASDRTNQLLLLLVQHADNSSLTATDLNPPPFSPSASVISINCLFSLSLILSLLASFGALIGQQWIVYFAKPPTTSKDIRLDRVRKLHGADRWKLSDVLEFFLPTVLQAALAIFLVGFIQFLAQVSGLVALFNGIFCAVGALAFIITLILPMRDAFCPFQTPVSTFCGDLIWSLAKGVDRLLERDRKCPWSDPMSWEERMPEEHRSRK